MTDKQRTLCLREAEKYSDRTAYISDLSLSSIWGDEDSAEVPAGRVEELERIYDAYHRPVREIAAAAGLSQRKLAERFCIPYHTMERWCGGQSACPVYTRLMMQEILGL